MSAGLLPVPSLLAVILTVERSAGPGDGDDDDGDGLRGPDASSVLLAVLLAMALRRRTS